MRLFLTFGSAHGALKAERILAGAHIAALVVPKPSAIRGACGMAVRLDGAVREPALAALAAAGHPPLQEALLR